MQPVNKGNDKGKELLLERGVDEYEDVMEGAGSEYLYLGRCLDVSTVQSCEALRDHSVHRQELTVRGLFRCGRVGPSSRRTAGASLRCMRAGNVLVQ